MRRTFARPFLLLPSAVILKIDHATRDWARREIVIWNPSLAAGKGAKGGRPPGLLCCEIPSVLALVFSRFLVVVWCLCVGGLVV